MKPRSERKSRTLQSNIFYTFSAFAVFLIVSFTLIYYLFISETLKARAFDSIYRLTGSISNQVDTKLQSLNTLTINTLFSSTLVDLVHDTEVFDEHAYRLPDRWKMNELVYLISGIDFPLLQLNILRTNGDFYGFGYNNRWTRFPAETLKKHPNFEKALALGGRRLLSAPHLDEWNITNRTVVSLYRSFPPSWGLPDDAVLELQYDYAKLSNLVSAAERSPNAQASNEVRTWIFDEEGTVVYPYPSTPSALKNAAAIWASLKKQPAGLQTWSGADSKTGTSILAQTRSDFSGWTVVVAESEAKLLEPVLATGYLILLTSAIVIALALLLSWIVSRNITRPIKKIHESINSLRLETLHSQELQMIPSNINELEELNSAFHLMHAELKSSLNEVVASRSHEIHSRLLALQSQMNPHFLFNTMVNISIMAEEHGADDIVKACSDLSNMLRYISRDGNVGVSVEQELEHTVHYLDLMKTRYEGRFLYEVAVPPDLLKAAIPRLVIQPLAENSLKYGIERDPPWCLRIEGLVTGDSWRVTVSDNGPGFEPQFLETLRQRLALLDPPNSVPDLEFGGMGLVNIYIRLKLHYENEAVFLVENLLQGGAKVTIGGRYAEKL